MAKDIFQQIDTLDAAGLQRIIERLEFRGGYAPFVRMREDYLDRMALASNARVHELGCGTGVVARAIAKRPGFGGRIVGSDFATGLIDAARRFAAAEGLGARLEFRVSDAQRVGDESAAYDAVIAHTLVSHVPDPEAVIAQCARLVRPAGTVAIFDGDYASLGLSSGDRALDAQLNSALLSVLVAQPLAMRELPRMARKHGLRIAAFIPAVLVEPGKAEYFGSLAETFAPLAARAELVAPDAVQRWLAAIREASANGTFYGTCNFCTYLLQRDG
jgi:2-polyprenyl-3-methyl-5-hydroxy-6-metoxy-1,4-benzoquinol methylase